MEDGDHQQIFGKPWDHFSANDFAANLKRLNVTTIVAGAGDKKAMTLMDSSPLFTRYWQNDYFTIYHLNDNAGDWIETSGASARLVERSARRWVIEVQESSSNATLLLKMSHYPLWQARVNGHALPLTATADGLQEIALSEGGPYTIEVTYREGLFEWAGLFISIAGLFLMAVLLYRYFNKSAKATVTAKGWRKSYDTI
jgi:hypothetical protein